MPRHDIGSRHAATQSIAPAVYTSAQNGSAVVLDDATSAMIAIALGAWNDGTHTFAVQEADDDGSGNPDTWADVADADLVDADGDGTLEPVFDGSGKANAVHLLSYIGNKPHVRVVTTQTGVTNGAAYAATIFKGDLRRQT